MEISPRSSQRRENSHAPSEPGQKGHLEGWPYFLIVIDLTIGKAERWDGICRNW